VLLLLSIFIFYRKKSIVIATTLTIVVISILMLGILGLFKQKLNMVSAILPSLVLIMCLEDIIFIFSHYYDTPENERDITKTLAHVMVPCFFTSLTTALGFFSFSISPMKILKYFGMFAALAVVLEYIVSIIIGTFVLVFIESRKTGNESKPAGKSYETMFKPWLEKLNGIVQSYYKQITIVFVIILAIGAVGILRITVDTFSMGMLLKSNPIRQNSNFFEKDYGYYVPLEIRLIPASGTIKDPAFLKKLDGLQKLIEKEYGYKSTSVADVVKQLNKVLTDGKESSYIIPDTQNAVAQELLMYEMDGKGDLFYFTNNDMNEARLTVRVPMASSQTFKQIKNTIENTVRAEFGESSKIIFGGYIPLYVKLIDYIAQTQIESFMLAFFLIFLSTTILLRSAYYLLIIVIPNIIPIVFTLGFMGFTGIDLDIATVTVAAITIGLSVDNTIHYLYYFKTLRAKGMEVKEAVGEALRFKGAPMFISNIILVFGYLIMVFGHVTSVVYFGLLVSLTLTMAMLCDMLLLPSLILIFNKKK
jgi:hypothetical protein